MRLNKKDLDEAVSNGVIERSIADNLWGYLESRQGAEPESRFNLTDLLWFTGALIIITAMSLFSTEAFSRWGGDALAATAVLYGVIFMITGSYFWFVRHIYTLGGLLITVAVTMAPLAIFGIQYHFGWWTHGEPGTYRDFFVWIRGSWVFMSISMIVAGLIALKFFKFPFITMAIAFALWFLSMDLTPWFVSHWPDPGEPAHTFSEYDRELWKYRGIVSTLFGIAVLVFAWIVDLRTKVDFTFWLHLTVGLCVYGGIYLWISPDSPIEWMIVCIFSIIQLLLAVFLQRHVYAVFGGLGLASYLGYLSSEVFQDTIVFSFALSGIGILVMVLGYFYFKHANQIQSWIGNTLPPTLSGLRPKHENGPI
ncbi:hypothetical protein N9H39_06550 [Gammaproteobacteria bacterium]|nr:hypothetical protein [Gammaproteobacteria bacterium]